ncbi:acyltransferase [Streptomyces sp. NPDC050560]|uniref:acyltransferase n=1 Tax=Streptomyces sp. NPDC050560 TaxID=3365630 RepID=UPI0037A34D5B
MTWGWARGVAQRAVHGCWRLTRRAGAVTARHPGRLRFGALGPGSRLAFPQGDIFNEHWIHLGADCRIGERVHLTAGLSSPADLGPDPVVRIGDGVVIGRGSHVIAVAPVTIGAKCWFAPNVYVTSVNHAYDDPFSPIGEQWPRAAPVEIGPGSWIGVNAVILPGARIGANVVVAAGAVVRGEVPDRSVVAGTPAKVVRRWLPGTGWQPPLPTPAPAPIPRDMTPEQLVALARLAPAPEQAADAPPGA